jgi:heme exporter protein A
MNNVADNQPGLSAEGLLLFRGERCLLSNVAVRVQPGEGLVLRGANGTGKTTLLRVLCGLTQAEEGQVCWNAIPINRQRESWNQAIGWSGHQAGLKSELTVRENLQFSAELAGRKLGDVPDELGLTECLGLPARVLSAGQQRRSSLARVLLSNALIWFLDEPYTNLDTQGQTYLNTCIDSHLASGGLTVIASHGEAHSGLGMTELVLERGRAS